MCRVMPSSRAVVLKQQEVQQEKEGATVASSPGMAQAAPGCRTGMAKQTHQSPEQQVESLVTEMEASLTVMRAEVMGKPHHVLPSSGMHTVVTKARQKIQPFLALFSTGTSKAVATVQQAEPRLSSNVAALRTTSGGTELYLKRKFQNQPTGFFNTTTKRRKHRKNSMAFPKGDEQVQIATELFRDDSASVPTAVPPVSTKDGPNSRALCHSAQRGRVGRTAMLCSSVGGIAIVKRITLISGGCMSDTVGTVATL